MKPKKTTDDEKEIRAAQPLIEKDEVKQAGNLAAKAIKKPENRPRRRLW
jgi:hypothetical protein